ncbi:unnamed protein product, partial [Prorocentrum cordatum]
ASGTAGGGQLGAYAWRLVDAEAEPRAHSIGHEDDVPVVLGAGRSFVEGGPGRQRLASDPAEATGSRSDARLWRLSAPCLRDALEPEPPFGRGVDALQQADSPPRKAFEQAKQRKEARAGEAARAMIGPARQLARALQPQGVRQAADRRRRAGLSSA